MNLDSDYIIMVEDSSGNIIEDAVVSGAKYSIENNSLYMLECGDFHIEFMNDFENMKVDIPSDYSSPDSISKYKVKEIWEVNGATLVKVYNK